MTSKYNEVAEALLEKALTQMDRQKMSGLVYAIPERKKYPMNDAKRAALSLGQVKVHGTPSEQQRVKTAVCGKFPDLKECNINDSSTPNKQPKGNKPKAVKADTAVSSPSKGVNEGRLQFYITGVVGDSKVEVLVNGKRWTYKLPREFDRDAYVDRMRFDCIEAPEASLERLKADSVNSYFGDNHYDNPKAK